MDSVPFPTNSGMLQWSLVWLLLTCLASAFMINRYIDWRKQPVYLVAILIFSLALPLSIVVLLPVDLISTFCNLNSLSSSSWFYLNPSTVGLFWRLNYWMTFLLTWVVLPFLQYWFDSGYYKVGDRFKESLRRLLWFQLFMLACGAAAFGYIVTYHRSWLNFQFLKSLVITISHIYALVLALWLMAHGLVHIPRQVWENSGHFDERLQKAYMQVPVLKEKMEDSTFELSELCSRISTLENVDIPVEFRDWCMQLLNEIPEQFKRENLQFAIDTDQPLTTADINSGTLHDLAVNLHRLKWSYNHNFVTFDEKVQEVVRLEDEVDSQTSSQLTYRKTIQQHPRLNYVLCYYVQPVLGVLFSLALIALTVITVESEAFHGTKASLIRLVTRAVAHKPTESTPLAILAVCMPVLGYMLVCAMLSLFQVRIFNIYSIMSNQSSDPVSLIFFVSYACRLTIPLSYNFLMLLDSDFSQSSSFQMFLGDSIKLVPLGNFLNDILPRLLLVPMCFTYFRVWERLQNRLRGNWIFDYLFDELADYDFDEDDAEAAVPGSIDSLTNSRENRLVRDAKQIVDDYMREVEDRTAEPQLQPQFQQQPFPGEGLLSHLWQGISGFASRLQGNPSDLSSHLRPFRLLSGRNGAHITLDESESVSRPSMDSGISLNTTFDSDNSLLRDEEIQRLDSDDDLIV